MRHANGSYWSGKLPRFLRVNPFVRRCEKLLRRHSAVLDLGCGYGQDALYLATRGHHVTAVDFSPVSIKALRSQASAIGLTNLHALRRDISKRLPFPDASFDAVYAHLSVHYFDDRVTQRVFHEMHRVLKPGGLLFVKCKSINDPLYGKGERVGDGLYRHGHVRHFFSKEYMQRCLEKYRLIRLRRTSSTYAGLRSAFIEAMARKPKKAR